MLDLEVVGIALRSAFDATMADEDFLAEARRQGMEIGAMSGQDTGRIVSELVDAPPPLVQEIKRAIQVKGAVQLDGKRAGAE